MQEQGASTVVMMVKSWIARPDRRPRWGQGPKPAGTVAECHIDPPKTSRVITSWMHETSSGSVGSKAARGPGASGVSTHQLWDHYCMSECPVCPRWVGTGQRGWGLNADFWNPRLATLPLWVAWRLGVGRPGYGFSSNNRRQSLFRQAEDSGRVSQAVNSGSPGLLIAD